MPKWRNWYTRTTQNRVPQGLRVQVPPSAQKYEDILRLSDKHRNNRNSSTCDYFDILAQQKKRLMGAQTP